VHGALCGLLCAGTTDPLDAWLRELFEDSEPGDLLVEECRTSLHGLYRETLSEMDDPGLGFSLLLPDDERALAERTRALGEWCQGFLYGVGLSGVAADEHLSPEAREALQTLSEITRVDVEQAAGAEEDEEAFEEVYEFVWVAAMLIREELVPGEGGRG
jgi:hypothetical protein